MRLAIAQIDYTIGAFEANFEKMAAAVARARSSQVDLVVFTELATVGYPPGDLLERHEFVEANLEQLQRVARLSDDTLGILVGFVDRNVSGTGKGLYNAVALCDGGEVVARCYKCLLPTYDVFDEARYFQPGTDVRPLDFRGVKIGVSVCEDVWADPDLDGQSLYSRDPVLVEQVVGCLLERGDSSRVIHGLCWTHVDVLLIAAESRWCRRPRGARTSASRTRRSPHH